MELKVLRNQQLRLDLELDPGSGSVEQGGEDEGLSSKTRTQLKYDSLLFSGGSVTDGSCKIAPD